MNPADEHAELCARAAAAQAGDRAALEAVLARIRPHVLRYVLARVSDRGLAEDVTQEVLLTVVSALPRYVDTGRPFLAWVFGIAVRKVSEAYRAQTRRPETAVDELPDAGTDGSYGDPEAGALRLDATRQVTALLGRLPHVQAEVLRLRVAAGLSADETALALGMTPGAVRVAQHRALAKLRDELAAGGRAAGACVAGAGVAGERSAGERSAGDVAGGAGILAGGAGVLAGGTGLGPGSGVRPLVAASVSGAAISGSAAMGEARR